MIELAFSIFFAGTIGGSVNALLSDNGFMMPTRIDEGGYRIIKPGYLGNMLIGGIAALVSWGLYGPYAAINLFGGYNSTLQTSPGVTLASFVGGILVGIAGSRWLSNEVDKTLLRAAASEAASDIPDQEKSRSMSMATPEGALRIAIKNRMEIER